jgi:2-oxoglutarate dehydrogenase E2 component (dihydrolipoamide succinyltransferase)
MAESITTGALSWWDKKVGDFVKAGEQVVSIKTDKVEV